MKVLIEIAKMAVLLCAAAAATGAAAAEHRGVDPDRVDQNRADPSRTDQSRIDQKRVDPDRVNQRFPEQNGGRVNSSRGDDPLTRNNVDRDDPTDGVYPLELDYFAELRNCERLSGASATRCVEAVHRKYGQM
ncbi:MAG: hypothetical protein ABI619_07340 [Betaproteobacteria bacterium]